MIALERLPLALASRGGPLAQPLCPSQRSAVSPLSHMPSASLQDLAALVVSGQATPPVLEARVNSSVARGRRRPAWVSLEELGRRVRRRGRAGDPSAGPSPDPERLQPPQGAGLLADPGVPRSRGRMASGRASGQTPRRSSRSTRCFGALRKDFLMTPQLSALGFPKPHQAAR